MANRQWSTGDIKALRDMAGRMTVGEIASHFGVSEQTLRKKASREGISLLRRTETEGNLIICPACGRIVTSLAPSGICKVCVRRGRNEALLDEQIRLEDELEAIKAANEAEREDMKALTAEKDRLKSRNSWLRGKIRQEAK